MLVIGLTGGISTGKSTVSTLLRSTTPPTPLIDADIIARAVVAPGTPALAKIVKVFGEDILLEDGSLDRKKLGSIIFNDEKKRKQLNAIVHPAVRWEMARQVLSAWWRGEKYVILDVPLLVEGGLWRYMGKVVLVYCSEEIQLQRLMARDSSSREDALSRIRSQIPITDKVPYADIIIDNSGTKQNLDNQVLALVKRFDKEAGNVKWRLEWFLPPFALLSAVFCLGLKWTKWRRWRKRQGGTSKTKGN